MSFAQARILLLILLNPAWNWALPYSTPNARSNAFNLFLASAHAALPSGHVLCPVVKEMNFLPSLCACFLFSFSLFPLSLVGRGESSDARTAAWTRGNTERLNNSSLFLTQHKSPTPPVSSPVFPLDRGLQTPALTLSGNRVNATSRGALKVASG